MTKLSKRELVLVSILAIAAVIYGIVQFIVTPINNKIDEKTQAVEILESQQMEAVNKISQVFQLQKTNLETTEEIERISSKISTFQTDEQLERTLAGLISTYGLSTQMLTLREKEIEVEVEKGEEAIEMPFISKVVDLKLSGPRSNAVALVSALDAKSDYVVSMFSATHKDFTNIADGNYVITLICYMEAEAN